MLRIRSVGKVDENALPVFQRRDPHEGSDGLDVATGLADETAHVAVRELDLDRHGPASAFERLDDDFFRLLSQRLGHVLDERLVVHAGTRRAIWTVTPEAAAIEPAAAAAKITPCRSTSLRVAQVSPPASTGSARPRSAERPSRASP